LGSEESRQEVSLGFSIPCKSISVLISSPTHQFSEELCLIHSDLIRYSFPGRPSFFEDLRLDLTEEKRHKWDLTDQLPMVERFDAETAATLRRILAEEDNHRAQITDMLTRSDPLAEYPP